MRNRLSKRMQVIFGGASVHFDLMPIIPWSLIISHQAGLLAHPAYRAFPAFTSGKECDKL
jgi:hypothetical protein